MTGSNKRQRQAATGGASQHAQVPVGTRVVITDYRYGKFPGTVTGGLDSQGQYEIAYDPQEDGTPIPA